MSNADHQIVRCQCGAKLKVPAAAAGRKIACPKCGFKILIGAAAAASSKPSIPTAASPPPPPPPVEEDNLLDDLLSAESSTEASSTPDLSAHQTNCAKCKAPMAKDARICGMCGHDPLIKTPAATKGSKAGGKVKALAAGTGRFGIGCVCSAIGALVAAGIWYGVAIGTGFEIGYIAWAVGVFAGLGMKLGYGQENLRGALAAVTFAALGILAAKGMVYNSLFTEGVGQAFDSIEVSERAQLRCGFEYDKRGLAPFHGERDRCFDLAERYDEMGEGELESVRDELDRWYETGRWNESDYARTRLTYLYANEMPAYEGEEVEDDEDWEWNEAEAEKDWQRRYKAATERVDKMPEDQWVAEAMSIETRQREEQEANMRALLKVLGPSNLGFFAIMFGPIDALFILLALSSAFKLGGGTDE